MGMRSRRAKREHTDAWGDVARIRHRVSSIRVSMSIGDKVTMGRSDIYAEHGHGSRDWKYGYTVVIGTGGRRGPDPDR